jgi:hypothetical protein
MRTVLERDDDPRVLLTRKNMFTESAEIIVSGKNSVNVTDFVRCGGIDERRGDADDGDRDTERLADPRRKVVAPMSHPSPGVEDLSLGP